MSTELRDLGYKLDRLALAEATEEEGLEGVTTVRSLSRTTTASTAFSTPSPSLDVKVELASAGALSCIKDKFGDLQEGMVRCGLLEDGEVLLSAKDTDYERKSGECFISRIDIVVISRTGEKFERSVAAKAYLNSRVGKTCCKNRAHLMTNELPTVQMYGIIPGKEEGSVSVVFERFVNPSTGIVMEAIEALQKELLTTEDAVEIGKIAAVLDRSLFKPRRLLADIIMTEDGPRFNDFGFDLGEFHEKPRTYRYYGCDMEEDYDSGFKTLQTELRLHPELLAAAEKGYKEVSAS